MNTLGNALGGYNGLAQQQALQNAAAFGNYGSTNITLTGGSTATDYNAVGVSPIWEAPTKSGPETAVAWLDRRIREVSVRL